MELKRLYQKLDYDTIIAGKELDMVTYKHKFKMWDYVLEHNILDDKTNPQHKDAVNLLKDPTIYAYAFFNDDTNAPFRLTAYQDAISNCIHDHTEMNPNRYILFKAANQVGKVIDGNEKVLTTEGWKKHGKLKVGDKVYGRDGKPTKIVNVFPHKDWKFYKIKFNDGSCTYAGLEHKWICKTSKQRFRKTYTKNDKTWLNPEYDKWVVRTTEQIIKTGGYSPNPKSNWSKVSIPVCEPIHFNNKSKLKLNPYLVGVLLGDGSITRYTPMLTTDDKEIVKYVKQQGYDINKKSYQHYSIKGISKIMSEENLSGEKQVCEKKHIPYKYLYSSVEDRIELLRGLMDTDGSISRTCLEFCTVSKQLKNDFMFLINSLGCKVNKVFSRIPYYYNENMEKVHCKRSYRITFKSRFNPFKLKRKADKWKYVNRYKHERVIESIEYSHINDGSCIMVDNKDSSYLVGEDCIVTHNSGLLCILAFMHVFNESNVNVVMVSLSLPQSQALLAQIRFMLNNSKFADSWREDIGETSNTTVLSFQRELKDKEGKVYRTIKNTIRCAPCGEGLLGYPIHYLYLDEADFYENAKTFFWKVAEPRTSKTKGQIILFSNPNPEISRNESLLWELWNGDMFKRKFTFNFLDAPWNTREGYDMIKKNKPGYIFASTHDGMFPEDGGGFFKHSEIKRMLQKEWENELPVVDRHVFFGLDLAKTNDRSVLTIGTLHDNPTDKERLNLEVRYIEHFPTKTDYDIVIARLKYLIDYYQTQHGVAAIGFDATGVGKAVDDIMKMTGIQTATPIIFTNESKSRMYANFKMMAEQNRIKIVYTDNAESELSGLAFARTPTGKLTVKHSKEQIHDDIPDSIACLIEVALSPSIITPTVKFF